MNLRTWFSKFDVQTDNTESITNEVFDYLGSCEFLLPADKEFLHELDYNDNDIEQILEIMEEGNE